LANTKAGSAEDAWCGQYRPCQEAFTLLKEVLSSAILLLHFDQALRTAVHLDASQNVVGAVLFQWDVGQEHQLMVCFILQPEGHAEALVSQQAVCHLGMCCPGRESVCIHACPTGCPQFRLVNCLVLRL
jgi:hypothetical protein